MTEPSRRPTPASQSCSLPQRRRRLSCLHPCPFPHLQLQPATRPPTIGRCSVPERLTGTLGSSPAPPTARWHRPGSTSRRRTDAGELREAAACQMPVLCLIGTRRWSWMDSACVLHVAGICCSFYNRGFGETCGCRVERETQACGWKSGDTPLVFMPMETPVCRSARRSAVVRRVFSANVPVSAKLQIDPRFRSIPWFRPFWQDRANLRRTSQLAF